MSVLVAPQAASGSWGLLSLLAGLAVSRGLRVLGVEAALKWPNDVLVDGGKICGILSELVITPSGPMAVVGIGINVHQQPGDLPVDTATSLAIAGAQVSREEAAVAVLDAFGSALETWELEGWDGPAGVGGDYRAACTTLGRGVRVILGPDESVEGTAEGVRDDGALLVLVDGDVRAFSAGDVVHLR